MLSTLESTLTLPSLALGSAQGGHAPPEGPHAWRRRWQAQRCPRSPVLSQPRGVPGAPCSPSHPRSLQEPHSLAATAPGGTGISMTNDDEAAREIVENEL